MDPRPDLPLLKPLRHWGGRGDAPGQFHSPIGIAIDRHDAVYVTDLNNARLQIFTADGAHRGGFDLPWDVPERRSTQAAGIAVDDDGRLYLAFVLQSKIRVYTKEGRLLREWGEKGSGEGAFDQPGGIALAPDGTILVADQCNHRVQVFTRDGRFLRAWGGYGDAPGRFGAPSPIGSRFGGPHFVAVDRRGRVYTTEGVRGRVQQFDARGRFLRAWGDKGDQPGGFGALQTGFSGGTFGPIAVFADRRDRIWVSSLNDRVQGFTPEGVPRIASAPGQFLHPHGMAMDRQGRLHVCDAGNQRIVQCAVP